MPTYNLTYGWQYLSSSLGYTIAKTGSSETSLSESVATGQTAFLINVAIDVSEVKALFIVSDQDVTVKTNSSGAPDNTISLLANRPLSWDPNSYFANLLTVDVTKIYVANASGSAATLQIYVLQDATP